MYDVIIPFGAIILFAVIFLRLALKRSTPLEKRLADWASKEGYQIVASERRYMFRGPLSSIMFSGAVFYVVVKDHEHVVRTGFVSFHEGLFGSDWERVSWESPSRESPPGKQGNRAGS